MIKLLADHTFKRDVSYKSYIDKKLNNHKGSAVVVMGATHNLGFLLSKDYNTRKMNDKKLQTNSANFRANRMALRKLKDKINN
ncbi:hypothetical protein LC1Nh_0866 [Candidatus Nanohalobium constans]|uniref:Uncharacterized protein n=1 Tax=Candidatus Nanohalobium constans TaxID=2565781 RepID=A0A5Q0UHS5_9ARCH|nr:hypothetical protein LC1Nh_0866 [Candidatus Nanohalobium constans]